MKYELNKKEIRLLLDAIDDRYNRLIGKAFDISSVNQEAADEYWEESLLFEALSGLLT